MTFLLDCLKSCRENKLKTTISSGVLYTNRNWPEEKVSNIISQVLIGQDKTAGWPMKIGQWIIFLLLFLFVCHIFFLVLLILHVGGKPSCANFTSRQNTPYCSPQLYIALTFWTDHATKKYYAFLNKKKFKLIILSMEKSILYIYIYFFLLLSFSEMFNLSRIAFWTWNFFRRIMTIWNKNTKNSTTSVTHFKALMFFGFFLPNTTHTTYS